MRKSAVVIGSLNHDYILEIPRFCEVGETLTASGLTLSPGGKGANQAVQMAKLGLPTAMVGCVGEDADGDVLMASLEGYGVDVAHVRRTGEPTGMAAIEAIPDGRVTCVIVKGANYAVSVGDVRAAEPLLAEAAWLVLQMEIPQEVNRFAIERARALGCKVLLNAAPAAPMEEGVLRQVDLLVLNEIEAAFYLGHDAGEPDSALAGAAELHARYGADCVVTIGALGSAFRGEGGEGFVAAEAVAAVESTGAGDSYVGALAKALVDGATLEGACRFATRCAAVTVGRPGAQPSMPTLADIRP